MIADKVNYSKRLLRGGDGLLAWQRLSRFRKAVKEIGVENGRQRAHILVDVGAADGIGLPFWSLISDKVLSFNYYMDHCREFHAAHSDSFCAAADGRNLPISSASVDVVTCMETLHLLPGPDAREKCLKEIWRVLKPNGLFVCSVAIEVGAAAIFKYILRKWKGFELEGMTPDLALKHTFPTFFDVSKYDVGRQIGFDAYKFADQVGYHFEILKRINVPVARPLCTNLLLICRRRQDVLPFQE